MIVYKWKFEFSNFSSNQFSARWKTQNKCKFYSNCLYTVTKQENCIDSAEGVEKCSFELGKDYEGLLYFFAMLKFYKREHPATAAIATTGYGYPPLLEQMPGLYVFVPFPTSYTNFCILNFRTEFWKSNPRKQCDFCKCWIADNRAVSKT